MPTAVSRPTEAELLAKAKAGDFEAFADLCEPCRKSVCAYLVGSGLAEPDDAEDVFVDALLRARNSIEAFNGSSKIETWLTAIARNLALDRRRAQAAHPIASYDENPDPHEDVPTAHSTADPLYQDSATAPAPYEQHDGEVRAAIVRKALDALQGKTREAIILFYLEQKPYNEIAEILDIPIGTVMSRLHNGRKRLEQLLRPHAEDLGF